MVAEQALAYFDRDKAAVTPEGPAHHFKTVDDKVPLLWGDEVFVIEVKQGTALVSAKGHKFGVPVEHLRDDPILSWYQIDCGQGDAALVQLPDRRWLMVDAGPAKGVSNSPAGATGFLIWKMFVDQSWKNEFGHQLGPFELAAAIATHPDTDHFAGFRDLNGFLDSGTLVYDTVFHCGLGRFDGARRKVENGSGHSQLGPVVGSKSPDLFVTELLDDFDDVARLSKSTAARAWQLSGTYASWLEELRARHGQGVGGLRRVDASMDFLPGFEPSAGEAAIRVLGPVLEPFGQPNAQLRFLDSGSASGMKSPSLTRNGQSIVLRIDYGKARLMLTGDLNFNSQAVLMNTHADEELRCHVAKACHHGSDDISHTFLAKMAPLATLFSSGDNETHVHPRARALALAAAATPLRPDGSRKQRFLGFEEPRVDAPLIYSTELSRSVELFDVGRVSDKTGKMVRGAKIANKPRSRSAESQSRSTGDWLLADKLVYGLLNVRTDGDRILIGVMNEGSKSYHVEVLDL